MWVDIDDLRAEIRSLERETEEEIAEKKVQDEFFKALHVGILVGYTKVEQVLDDMEEVYRKQGLEHIRSLREEGNE